METGIIITLILMSTLAKETLGLYGYDCGEQLSNLTTISLIEVGDCDIKQPEVDVKKIKGQLIQINSYEGTQIYKCSIKITRTITTCGMWSHGSRVKNGEISYYKEMTHGECMRLQKTGFYSIGNTQIMGVPGNSTTHKSVTFAGRLTQEGDCKGSTFADPYGTWDDVIVAGWIEIYIEDYFAEIHIESNKIKLRSGIACKLTDETCTDQDGAHVCWQQSIPDTCGANKYSVLYEGTMDKIYEKGEKNVMYTLEEQEITFALWKKGEQNVCGYKLIKTEHPKLLILETENQGLMKNIPTITANLDIFTYVNSKFVYVEKMLRGQITKMYYDIIKNKCELERKILKNAISIATISPTEAGLRIMEQPGYLGLVTGEVVHLMKCLRVEVKFRKVKECYNQLPVWRGNEALFLSPRTRVLLRTGTPINCDKRLPAMFKIGDGWVRLLPDIIDANRPEILQPQTKPTWEYHSPGNLANGGIYGERDIGRLRDMLLLFPMEKAAILNNIALGVTGKRVNNKDISFTHFLDQEALEAIANSTWNKMWSKFLTFGTASAGIIGMLMIGRLIKLIIDTIIHGYAIYSLYGFSIHLIGSIWNSVTQLLLHLGQRQNKDRRDHSNNKQTNEQKDEKIDNIQNIYPTLEMSRGNSI